MITLMRPEHVSLVTDLMREMHANSRYKDLPYSSDRVLQLFNLCTTTDLAKGFVIIEDDRAIGLCVMMFDSFACSFVPMARDLCIYITPSRRGYKLFRTLVTAVEEWCMLAGIHHVIFELSASVTGEELERTNMAFERAGYKRIGVLVQKELGHGS